MNKNAFNHRTRALAVLNYQPVDRLPIVHFGFWGETLEKWHAEGHLEEAEWKEWADGNSRDRSIGQKLGFDFNWYSCFRPNLDLLPAFERKVMRELPDGTFHVRNVRGVIELQAPGAGSIPAEVEHLLTDRASWEEHYQWRYKWNPDRIEKAMVSVGDEALPFGAGGLELLNREDRDVPLGLHCGSLYGHIRNVVGVENLSLMTLMDPELFEEILEHVAALCLRGVEYVWEKGARFDFGHFWEDICFNNGPLVQPDLFREKVGPWYRRITKVLSKQGVDIVSVDCDGKIDGLVPIWLENGVNTMFPIEVGTWDASIGPWREKYGKELLGVGGMNKTVFSRDRAAVDAEVERLRPLVELGGYIPCPDHRIAPDAKWELVQYYTDRMRQVFGV